MIVLGLAFFATGLMSQPGSGLVVGNLQPGGIINPPIQILQMVKWGTVKSLNHCSDPKHKHKITEQRSVCFETVETLSNMPSMPVTFLNCSGSIVFFATATGACNIQTGKVVLGPAESTYIRSKGSLGHAGYDIFVFGESNSRYIEFDVVDTSTYTEAQIVAHRQAKVKIYKDIKACLKKVVSTSGAKCVISTLGLVTE